MRDQLSQQRITFAKVDALTAEERESPCKVRYAGQALTTGKQAECYANDYIALHVKDVAGGKTYAELRQPEMALAARVAEAEKTADPALPALQRQLTALRGQRGALFQGETSRGLLPTSFGFSDLGAKAGQAATVAFAAPVLLALLSLAAIARGLSGSRETAAAASISVNGSDGAQLVGA